MENGYHLYSFSGQLLREEPIEQFKQFIWRPRPERLLSKEEMKNVRKNLREYSRAFEEADVAKRSSADKAVVEERRRKLDEWLAYRERTVEDLLDERFLMLNGDVLTDLDLTAQIAQHEASGAQATLALTPVEDPSAYGLVRLAPGNEVTEFVEAEGAQTVAHVREVVLQLKSGYERAGGRNAGYEALGDRIDPSRHLELERGPLRERLRKRLQALHRRLAQLGGPRAEFHVRQLLATRAGAAEGGRQCADGRHRLGDGQHLHP